MVEGSTRGTCASISFTHPSLSFTRSKLDFIIARWRWCYLSSASTGHCLACCSNLKDASEVFKFVSHKSLSIRSKGSRAEIRHFYLYTQNLQPFLHHRSLRPNSMQRLHCRISLLRIPSCHEQSTFVRTNVWCHPSFAACPNKFHHH